MPHIHKLVLVVLRSSTLAKHIGVFLVKEFFTVSRNSTSIGYLDPIRMGVLLKKFTINFYNFKNKINNLIYPNIVRQKI